MDSEDLTPRAVEVQVLLARMGDVKKPGEVSGLQAEKEGKEVGRLLGRLGMRE